MSHGNSDASAAGRARQFRTTRWTIVLAAGRGDAPQSSEALESLCQAYWLPVYGYVRRMSLSTADAQDLTQAFFAHLLEKDVLAKADPARGRFRSFLLASLVNFLASERDKERAQKRGGGRSRLSLDFATAESRHLIEPADELTPERLFERRWALALLDQVLDMLRAELAAEGKERHFDHLKGALTGEMDGDGYERAGQQLGISPAAAKQAAYRLRKRYRELFRLEVARTVTDDAEVDDEIGRLMEILSG